MILFWFKFYCHLILTERVRRDRTDSGDADRGSSFVSSKVSQHGRRPDLRELFELRWTRSWEEHVQRWNSETMFATGLYRSSLFRSISFFFFSIFKSVIIISSFTFAFIDWNDIIESLFLCIASIIKIRFFISLKLAQGISQTLEMHITYIFIQVSMIDYFNLTNTIRC